MTAAGTVTLDVDPHILVGLLHFQQRLADANPAELDRLVALVEGFEPSVVADAMRRLADEEAEYRRATAHQLAGGAW